MQTGTLIRVVGAVLGAAVVLYYSARWLSRRRLATREKGHVVTGLGLLVLSGHGLVLDPGHEALVTAAFLAGTTLLLCGIAIVAWAHVCGGTRQQR